MPFSVASMISGGIGGGEETADEDEEDVDVEAVVV
jgi:hypothetical protein